MKAEVDVLIVGAGPVGLMLANQLGLRGVSTLIVERNASTVHEPRAIGYDDETCRALQSVGLSARFAEHATGALPMALLNKKGKPLIRIHMTEKPYGHPWFGTFYQPTLERILAEGARRFESVDLRFEHELVSFEQGDPRVRAVVRDKAGRETSVRTSWLVGCDGGASGVRRSLDTPFKGSTYVERWLVVDCLNDPYGRQEANFLCDTGRPTVSVPAPDGRRRWEFLLNEGEEESEMCTDETVSRLLSAYHDPALAEIERRTVYTFHARAARRFRVGRVLLAGDAAHVMPPFAGQGMNSGIRDAFNLGWKLALVIQGLAGPELIDSYERERRWHVRKMTQLAVFLGWVVMPTSRSGMFLRDALFGLANAVPQSRAFLASGKLRQPPALGRQGLFHTARGSLAGHMLPQIDAQLDDGTTSPLDDLFGQGFAVLGVDVDPMGSDDAWARLARQLGARSVCIHTSPTQGVRDDGRTLHVFDRSGTFRDEIYRANPHMLIRPDRFVAASVPTSQRAKAAAAVASLLQLKPGSFSDSANSERSREAIAP